MTSERRADERPDRSTHASGSDAAHLDEDPEALEDPVHCGDAKHQHDLHEQGHSASAADPVQRD